MAITKYKITVRDLESKHSINKLERDGFTREKIVQDMYKLTDGASTQERNAMMNKVYDRSEK